jgi:hypothetical protein
MKLVVCCLLPFILIGCASVYTQNSGGLPIDAIAVLEHNWSESGGGLIVQRVDDKWRGLGAIQRYELLPGEHTLTVAYFDGAFMGTGKLLVKFNAESGKTYSLKELSEGLRWSAAVVDKESGAIVSETTRK